MLSLAQSIHISGETITQQHALLCPMWSGGGGGADRDPTKGRKQGGPSTVSPLSVTQTTAHSGCSGLRGKKGHCPPPPDAIKGFAGTLLQLCLNSLATLPLGGLDKH